MAIHHTSAEDWKYRCQRCGETFPVVRELRKHEEWDHITERNFVCDLCPRSFLTARGLGAHKILRHGVIKTETLDES